MSNQNRFLLPHSSSTPSSSSATSTATPYQSGSNNRTTNNDNISSTGNSSSLQHHLDQENQLSVDTDFDSYWEEEARNPNRNRIRIGRQYQATVPPLLKQGEKDQRKLEDLETLTFCPKRSAKVSNAELDHYFTVAKSLNLFASLVETRSLLGRDVTIADLNHIRNKEGLSLASVIQPTNSRQTSNVSPQSSSQVINSSSSSSAPTSAVCSNQQSPPNGGDNKPSSISSSSPRSALSNHENYTLNQPLMKALSHFISLHHPCHHDESCKKLLKDTPFEDESVPTVSITAGNLRQGSSKEQKVGRSRSSLKQQQQQNAASSSPVKSSDEPDRDTNSRDNTESDQQQASGEGAQSSSIDEWTREEVELFSKAIEVCGKNFSSIKKEFLPSKSVKSIVEYYYIGSRDVSDSKKKSSQAIETGDSCSSPEKSSSANNNNQGGNGGGSSFPSAGKSGLNANHPETNTNNNHNTSSSRTSGSLNSNECTQNQDQQQSSLTDSHESTRRLSLNQPEPSNLAQSLTSPSEVTKQRGKNSFGTSNDSTKSQLKTRTAIDARMSVYNFDDEFKDESPTRFECLPRAGAEVKPLKAKPKIPNSSAELEAGNSNVGSLKFFMDGQLVLKLNACQEQQEGVEKCHWVQSSEKVALSNTRQKRYTKRPNDRLSFDQSQNGSESNSVISSNHDEASKNDDSTADEDSKESANSFTNVSTTPRPKSFSASPTPKRLRAKPETNPTQNNKQQQQQQQQPQQLHQQLQQHQQLATPIDYNRIAVNNRMKERTDNLNQLPMVNQPVSMPWLQANSFAFAAALLGGLPFPAAPTSNLTPNQPQNNSPNSPHPMNITSKPMDLTLEHTAGAPRPIQTKPSSRSRNSRPKNN